MPHNPPETVCQTRKADAVLAAMLRRTRILEHPRGSLEFRHAVVVVGPGQVHGAADIEVHFCFFGRGKRIWFEQGDGSLLERLHDLHTRSKHADKAIEQGHYIEDSPLCVWLTNSGLSSTEAALTFEEIAMILTDMAQLASAVQDPLTMESKIKSLMAE